MTGVESIAAFRRPIAVRGVELTIAIGLAAAAVGLAAVDGSPVRLSGAAALVVAAIGAALRRSAGTRVERLLLTVGVALLALTDIGLATPGDDATLWRPLVALIAYPLIGRALLLQVGRNRVVRAADLVVEAVLIGAAAGIILQVGIESQAAVGFSDNLVSSALPTVLVGLDVALLVILGRSLDRPEILQGPLGVAALAGTGLLLGHLTAAIENADIYDLTGIGIWLAGAGLVGLGVNALLVSLSEPLPLIRSEPPLFSVAHAVIVSISVVAAPVVLTIQAVTEINVSPGIAAGASLSAIVLTTHVVTLLRERAISEHEATHDPLTDLPNRLLFGDRLERAIAHAERNGLPIGVLYIDLDRFKDVNDTLGHDAGDQLLRITAQRLLACARNEDTVARLAGDEFAVLLPHLRSADDVLIVANRAAETLQEPATIAGRVLTGAASVGVAIFPVDGRTPAELLTAADTAMYRSKDQGGGTVGVFSSKLSELASNRLEVETALHLALQRDELRLFYQPIIDTATNRICGAESLVRWEHPERGFVSPGEFIPIAEQSDLIVDVGDWVLHEACRQLVELDRLGFGDRFVNVNLSARQFRHDIVSAVTAALRATRAAPSKLVVEITESAAVDDIVQVSERLGELREIGVRAVIDDFGTGYCGLQYLADLPVAGLKIDQSFIRTMTPRSASIVAATIAMAHSLGLSVVAEGVETPEQERFLTHAGCDRLQGYHLGRPMPAADFVARLCAERDSAPAEQG